METPTISVTLSNRKIYNLSKIFSNFIISISSIGCGIGYGYLHRIPLRDEAHRPKEPPITTPASDGFSEVEKPTIFFCI